MLSKARENIYPRSTCQSQQIDIEIPHGSRDHLIVPSTIKIMFNLDIESTDKARNVVNNVGRALVKKKVLMLGSRDMTQLTTHIFTTLTKTFT